MIKGNPFIKWVDGKRQLLIKIKEFYSRKLKKILQTIYWRWNVFLKKISPNKYEISRIINVKSVKEDNLKLHFK